MTAVQNRYSELMLTKIDVIALTSVLEFLKTHKSISYIYYNKINKI